MSLSAVNVAAYMAEATPNEAQIQPCGNLQLEKAKKVSEKQEDNLNVHIMFHLGICNFDLRPHRNHW